MLQISTMTTASHEQLSSLNWLAPSYNYLAMLDFVMCEGTKKNFILATRNYAYVAILFKGNAIASSHLIICDPIYDTPSQLAPPLQPQWS